MSPSAYCYPPDAATALQQQWPAHGFALPSPALLTQFLDVAYQASLLQEEGRPVLGHLVFAPDYAVADPADQTVNYQVLRFTEPRAYHAQELRRLSPTGQRPGHLLAVGVSVDQALILWGMVVTTRPWDYAYEPANPAELPPFLFLHVYGPGNLAVFCGADQVLVLQQGRLAAAGQPTFPAAWVRGHFTQGAPLSAAAGSPADVTLARELIRHTVRRTLAGARERGHGGMVVLVPGAAAATLMGPDGRLRPKYGVQANDAGTRYQALLQDLVMRCTHLGISNWVAYRESPDGQLQQLHTAVERFADLLADLLAVDGALVLSKAFDVLGFGVEIHAPALPTNHVYRALDSEAAQLQKEAADSGGTRHRAAYRLCQAEPDCLVMIISQDGGVKFVRQQQGQVIYWDQLPI